MERRFFILVPVYKVEKFIDDCIQSVLAQTYGNFRLILVDDGSPDRSGQICDAYAQKDSRICVIHKENGGQSSARNAAISRMLQEAEDTDFAVFLDSDDSLAPQTLQRLNDTIDQHGCDMVFYGFCRVFEGKVLPSLGSDKKYAGVPVSKREFYRAVFLDRDCNALWRKAVTKRLIQKMQEGYQKQYDYIRMGEDLLQSLPMYKHCEKAVFIPDRLYAYMTNPNSVTVNRAAHSDFLDSTVRRLTLEFLEQQPEWTREDMDDYLRLCRKMLGIELVHIARVRGEKETKVQLFEKVRSDAYYQKILSTATTEDTLLNLLKRGQYQALLLCLKAYSFAVFSKQFARKILAR